MLPFLPISSSNDVWLRNSNHGWSHSQTYDTGNGTPTDRGEWETLVSSACFPWIYSMRRSSSSSGFGLSLFLSSLPSGFWCASGNKSSHSIVNTFSKSIWRSWIGLHVKRSIGNYSTPSPTSISDTMVFSFYVSWQWTPTTWWWERSWLPFGIVSSEHKMQMVGSSCKTTVLLLI